MCSADEIQVMLSQEVKDTVRSKCVGHSPIILAPAFDLFVWICPEKIA